jgi:hypothetical protein
MSTLLFEIRYEDGRREAAAVDGERALVGSASHCDVRLPMGDAAEEHLLVELAGDTVHVRALADSARTLLDGAPIVNAVLAEGAVLGVGRLRVLVKASLDRADKPKTSDQGKGGTARLAVLSLGLVGAIGLTLASFARGKEIAPAPGRTPELFAAGAVSCPKDRSTGALPFAEEQRDMAIATHERVPFAAHEGVVAVGLYRTAAACFRTAGATEPAGAAEQAAEALEAELSDEFRARRLRLSHVLALEDYELARADVAVLRALTAGKQGPYVEWLAQVGKQLAAKGER